MSTADNTSMRLVIIDRRRQVAALRLRGYTQREIQKGLEQEKVVNPKDGKPWSLGTINGDIKRLEASWHAEAIGEVSAHKARLFAELREVARACWKDKDYERVLKAIAQQRELLGTDAAKRSELTGPGGKPIQVIVNGDDAGVL